MTTSLLIHFGRSANTKVFKLRKAFLNNVTFIVVVLMVLKYYTSCLESKKMELESVRGVTCRSWPGHQWSHSGNNSKTGGLQAQRKSSPQIFCFPPLLLSGLKSLIDLGILCAVSQKKRSWQKTLHLVFSWQRICRKKSSTTFSLTIYLHFPCWAEKVEVLVFTDESISMLSILSAVPGSRTVHYLWALLPVCL